MKRTNKKNYKRTNSLIKKAKINFFKEATKGGIMSSKTFWRTVKPFLFNNGCTTKYFINIENDGNLTNNEQELVELFNNHFINIVEKSSGKKLESLGNSSDASQDEMTVKEIISVYSNHPSIRKIENLCVPENTFDLPRDTNKIIKSLNINKAKGPDGISSKFVKMPANVIDCHLANIINNYICISLNKYLKNAKAATVRPIFKKDDRTKMKNYPCKSFKYFFKHIRTISA